MPPSEQPAFEFDEASGERLGGTVELHYVARAGLLPELSRQTYDSFYKAIREAVLNALDADATQIEVDFSRVAEEQVLVVSDDGCGMSTRDFCEQFMSLGGSGKFGDKARFGRIGIGSLALLQYAEAATVETKRAGSRTATRARVQHPWNLERDERRAQLGDLSAGVAEEYSYRGHPGDHFTRLRLEGVNPEVWTLGHDPTAFYRLLEKLRRVLPLPWAESRLTEALAKRDPEILGVLRKHIEEWSAPILIHSPWERDMILRRRSFGEDQAGAEEWNGPPVPVMKRLKVKMDGGRREIVVAGFLLNQKRAYAEWSGITARVQNVAVEEQTFFDVTGDPGFRKYISGEIWLFGDLDRERLINIDRSSFNRECNDYRVAQRYLARSIVDFKSTNVQRPQREKVEVRRRIEDRLATIRAVEQVVAEAITLQTDGKGLPSSESGRGRISNRRMLAEELVGLGVEVVDGSEGLAPLRYTLDISEDGSRVRAALGSSLLDPNVEVGETIYRLVFAEGSPSAPPLAIRNRPREIVFNCSHPAHTGGAAKYQLSLALELAFLLEDPTDSAALYERMIGFIAAL